MRKIAAFLFIFFVASKTKAQFSVAVVAGPQSNAVTPAFTLLPDTVSHTQTRYTGISFGFVGTAPINQKQSLFFRTGAVYSARGTQVYQGFDTSNVDMTDGQQMLEATTKLKINYIDVPVNLLLKLPIKGKTKFLLGGGLQGSLFYNGSTDLTSVTAHKVHPDSVARLKYNQVINEDLPVGTANDKYRIFHLSANALTGFEFGRVFLTLNYSNGLTDFLKTEDRSFRHQTIGFHLGIFLGNPNAEKQVLDRDNDGVNDDEDECPTIAGPLLTKGCPDADGDGIADKNDKCADQPGTIEYNGCPVPDRDHDGIPDEQDACPDQAGPANNKGCPYFDTDGDGILDKDDKCPEVAGTQKYKGCPVPDTDNDGVNDEEDQCPSVKGTKENHGCPTVTKEQQQKVTVAAKQIQFEFKSFNISPASYNKLNEVVDILKNNPTLHLKVEGHTSGPQKESNIILSQKRADSVKDYFVSKGIDESRISATGFGSARHITKDGDKKENPEDRRVELIVY